MKFPIAVALATALLLAGGSHAQSPEQDPEAQEQFAEMSRRLADVNDELTLLSYAREAEAARRWPDVIAVLARLVQVSPENPHHRFRLAAAYAQMGAMSPSYNLLLQLQRSGVAFPIDRDPRFAKLHGTELWTFLVDLNKSALDQPFGEGSMAFQIPPADRLLESIAYDRVTEAFLFGSARDGIIYRRASDGQLSEWAKPQGDLWWSIFDLKLSPDGREVWATSAAVPHFRGFKPEMFGRSALLRINRASGELIAAYPAPDDGLPHILNGIAVSSRGLVVVADGLRGQMFKLEGDALQPMMAERRLNSLRGLVFSPDDSIIYFSDHEFGLFGIEMATGTAFDVQRPENVTLYGIEGLFQYEGQLVAIQNGFQPNRVMRFELSEDGRRIVRAVPIEAGHEAFETPTLGTLVGDELFYIANSQRSYYDDYGLRKGLRPLPPVKVVKTNVRFHWDFQPIPFPGVGTSPQAAPQQPDDEGKDGA